MRMCDDRQVPKPATGKTPVRNARVPDEVWLPALAKAEAQGETASDAVEHGLRMYSAEPLPAAYEFTVANWPEAREWARIRPRALAATYSDLVGAWAMPDFDFEYLTVAAWLAATHHPADVKQQKRVITGHILRHATAGENNLSGWRDRYRDSRHLSETVQAILERHLPLGEG
jgi:hypothetical protein